MIYLGLLIQLQLQYACYMHTNNAMGLSLGDKLVCFKYMTIITIRTKAVQCQCFIKFILEPDRIDDKCNILLKLSCYAFYQQ